MEILPDLAKALLVPPTCLYLLGIFGWFLLDRRPMLGRSLLALSGGLLIALSLPIIAYPLYNSLNHHAPLEISRTGNAKAAIVILGGEASWAGEYGGEVPGAHTVARLRYGARLHKSLQLPVLVTGGPPDKGRQSVAELMAKALKDDYGVIASWQETKARNTYENAALSADILQNHDIGTVYLVTHAVHMIRAKATFEGVGLAVIPAPVQVPPVDQELSYRDFMPNAHALSTSTAAIYEYLAQVWYYFREELIGWRE